MPCRNGSVGKATLRRSDLNQGLQPVHAARTVSNDLNLRAAVRCFLLDSRCNSIRAHRQGARVLRNINCNGHGSRASARISLKRSSVTRPKTSLSTMTDGDNAQFPRQYTGSSEQDLSAV